MLEGQRNVVLPGSLAQEDGHVKELALLTGRRARF